MLKVLINNEEVIANQNFTINKHMLNTPSVILNNVCPKEWKENRNYSGFYHPLDYSKCKILDVPTEEEKIGQYQKITNSGTITNVDSTKENEITQLDGLTTQEGTPTPSSPQPINVVSGRQDIVVEGKNLFSLENIVNNGAGRTTYEIQDDNIVITATSSGTYRYVYKQIDNLTIGQEYTIKIGYHNDTSTNKIAQWGVVNSQGNYYVYVRNLKNYQQLTFTPTETSATFRAGYLGNSCNQGDILTIGKIQLEKGSTPSSYEKYKGQSYEINLGKNLLPNNASSQTKHDIVFTKNEDGSVYAKGTASALTQIDVYGTNANPIPNTFPNGTYTLSGGIKANQTLTIKVFRTGGNNYYASSGTGVSFTIDNNTTGIWVYLNIANGQVVDGTFYPMLEKGSSASSYSAYKTPIELCKIGNYQDFIKKGTGNNLYSGGDTLEDRFTYMIPSKIGKTYTLSFKGSTTLTGGSARIFFRNYEDEEHSSSPVDSEVVSLTSTMSDYSLTITSTINGYLFIATAGSISGYTFQQIQLEEGTATEYEPYGMYNKWYLEKNIGKTILNGSETWNYGNNIFNTSQSTQKYIGSTITCMSNYFSGGYNKQTASNFYNGNSDNTIGFSPSMIFIRDDSITSKNDFTTWLSTHNTIVYYVLATPTYTEITDSELIGQLNSVKLIEGLNNISISSPYLSTPITFHYNYWLDKLLFCGVVKNSGKISLNPREPHYTTLQILDFKDFLSIGETFDYVIYQKTILEAIQQVIDSISDYGFVLGNVNILNPDDIIGAYSTKDKTAYDVFNYIADITQSRWTTRMINENQVAIDFYDPTLMPEGTEIDYTDTFFKNNLIDDISYNYGTNNYRNKQVMISNQVVGNLAQIQTFTSNGYQDQYIVELPVAEIQKIYVNGEEKTFASNQEYQLGINADFYYTINSNIIESENILDASSRIEIYYIPIIEGRQVIVNENEISRINTSTGRKGIVSRYEQRNDATTSLELQKIGESYIKYKGTPEIVLTIQSRTNIWEVGEKVQFNAPIDELDTTYMVRTKKINYIASQNTLFYTYELVSSFNSETEINYFDNQRAKSKGNIGDGEYISRNIDIENTANIIFYDTTTTEITPVGDNVLESVLNSPFTN